MGVVFQARALLFLNLDIVTYVAGVPSLSFWRYALANFLGMLLCNILVVFLSDPPCTEREPQHLDHHGACRACLASNRHQERLDLVARVLRPWRSETFETLNVDRHRR